MSESTNKMQQMIMHWHGESQKADLSMDMKKTKVIFNNDMLDHVLRIDKAIIKCIQECIYLVQKIGACPNHEK